MTTAYTQPINRNTAYHIDNPTLRQIAGLLEGALMTMNCPIRFRPRRGRECTVLRVSTHNTDHVLRFSVLDRNTRSVHMQAQRYVSAFDNPERAGWRGAKTVDFATGQSGLLLPSDLAVIITQARDWLALNGDNARSPRTPFPVKDGCDAAPNRWIAGSFIIQSVQVKTEGGYHLVLRNDTLGLQTIIRGDAAEAFDAPMSIVNCRAVIHHDGTTRVLAKKSFDQLYSLLN